MGRISTRKRLKFPKKGRRSRQTSAVEEDTPVDQESEIVQQVVSHESNNVEEQLISTETVEPETLQNTLPISLDSTSKKNEEVSVISCESHTFPSSVNVSGVLSCRINDCHKYFHDYAKPNSPVIAEKESGEDDKEEGSSVSSGDDADDTKVPPPLSATNQTSLLLDVKKKVDLFLLKNWHSIADDSGLNILLLSQRRPKTVQRSLFFDCFGHFEISVHNHIIESDRFLEDAGPPVELNIDTVDRFVDWVVSIVRNVGVLEVCGGIDNDKYENIWEACRGGEVDNNLFLEYRYSQTFRSINCQRLVSFKAWRCDECTKLLKPLRRRLQSASCETPKKFTANQNLTEGQKSVKLKEQAKSIDCALRKIKRLETKMASLIKNEGVSIDDEVSNNLTDILKLSNISPAQEVFLHQQVKASQVKKKCGMRWHPTMIRLALSLHNTSPAAYELLRDTGMVKLPSGRTLFDYSNAKPITEGIDSVVLESISKRVKEFPKPYQKYHVLLVDEMYISKNLVFQKSTGKMLGFTKLDEVDREVRLLEQYLDDQDETTATDKEIVASRILCYMVKGVANNVKEVVASYAVSNVSVNQMYLWTWQVISALEGCGVKVVALVCDGSSTNRAFIKMHEPVTKLSSGIVIDTINKAAPSRVLYFLSDVAHLLKTIRNCFAKSRSDKNKGKRCMKRRGKKIVWDYIIRLYMEKRHKTFRKSHKLNPVNVFPDSFSCMKVCYAAQVLSRTVANDLECEKYPGVSETVRFIREVNDWFDRLNGAHSSVGKKNNNRKLDPYCAVDDERFEDLLGFLTYLDEWKKEAYSLDCSILSSTVQSIDKSGCSEPHISFTEEEDEEPNEDTPASKRILSQQTLIGIEMTTRSFVAVVKFLLQEGAKFINARVFSQDPLEQHFSKQRAGRGGSTNPNLQQFLNKNRAIHIQGQLGMKRRKGNTETDQSHVIVTTEPLPRRQKKQLLELFDH